MTDAEVTPTLLDRAIGWLSPRAGAERMYWRSAIAATRGYQAAKVGRRTAGWTATGGSANAEIGAGAQTMRNRFRAMVRDNPWAAVAVAKRTAATVGTGIVPRAATDDKATRQRYADEWSWFVENSDPEGRLDFYGQQNLAARTVFEAGEALIRFLPRPSSWNLRVPLQLQVLEPDWLDSSKTQRLEDGGAIIQGVQYDRAGRRTGYWLFDEHPGETVPISVRGRFQSRFVPASEVLHIFKSLRPHQARGVGMFAPVAMRLHDLDDFSDAERVRKKLAACFAAFVKRPPQVASPLSTPTTDPKGRRIEKLSPGLIQYLNQGEEVTFGTPPSADGYIDYMRMELHAVAAGCGMTYEGLTGDLSQVNYSSLRSGKLDFWDLLDEDQWLMMIPQGCRPVWRRVDNLLTAMGERRQAGMLAIWAPPKRRLVDPQKEIAAERDAIRSGLKTLRMAIAETGEDADELFEEMSETNTLLDKLGIVLDSDPRRTRPATTAAPQDAGTEPATAKE
ncbi:phage portal protein [Vineibacter terrae]|uniref:Phage portal protein n=1 Tax=Vineibacter terrae TaxID=2586908 RepID=A0A5C8P971_9HYPH|nr:phage portal protein [Vineibacter terrae]TXL70110.1 phage portal protein [Vineibacter terrae]